MKDYYSNESLLTVVQKYIYIYIKLYFIRIFI